MNNKGKIKKWEPKSFVRGQFNNIVQPGEDLTFGYNTEIYNLKDGQEDIIPKEVADHINKNCKVPIRVMKRVDGDPTNPSVPAVVGHKAKYQFIILEQDCKPKAKAKNSTR